MKQWIVLLPVLLAVGGVLISVGTRPNRTSTQVLGSETIVLKGGCQFDEAHAFTRALRKFEELVQLYYDGPLRFDLYKNSELGLEKDYFANMSLGYALDYGIVSPAHMSTFSPTAPLMDMPFLFRDLDHWNRVLDSDALQPILDEVAANADVILIGFAGGGTRNILSAHPVRNLEELRGLSIRVMGAPIQTRMFQAIQAAPTVIAYNEVYNAMQTGVIDAAENEAAGIRQMKFYEVGPDVSLTQHAITVRPICFSGKTFRKLPSELQRAILRAGREAGAYGRQLESTENNAILSELEAAGRVRLHPFEDREQLLQLAQPVQQAYSREIGAESVLRRIQAVQ